MGRNQHQEVSRIYYREGMKSKESKFPKEAGSIRTQNIWGICCEQWAILTERKREGGGRERGAKLDTVQLVNSLGCRESCLMEISQLLGKESTI